MANNFVVSSGKIIYHTTYIFIKCFRDSPVQTGSLPNTVCVAKIGYCLLLVMAISSLKTWETSFFKTSLLHAYYTLDI